MKYIYGPVPSRRLGFSLGVDIVPYKTCSFDCVYCQLGRTTNKTVKRDEYLPRDEILRDVNEAILGNIDYITFSGSGEPTLNSGIGWLIKKISKIKNQKSKIPVAVLTNGSLLWDEQVREDLMGADLVVPSLDAGNDEILESVNRPHPSLNIEKIVTGLTTFRKEYKGKIWLEIMLVKGVNDSLEHIKSLKSKLSEIKADKVQLNTVVRPSAEDFAQALSSKELEVIRDMIGGNCEVIAEFKAEKLSRLRGSKDIENRIVELVKRRPVTLADISESLGRHRNELIKYIDALEKSARIKKVQHKGAIFYEIRDA